MRCNQSDITQNFLLRTFSGREYIVREVNFYVARGKIRTSKKIAINLMTGKQIPLSRIYYEVRTVFDTRTDKVVAKRKTANHELNFN